jgi:hypothetical protein
MDAGIATDANLRLLKEKGYDYLCVARSTMKNYTVQENSNEVTVTDKENRKISLLKVKSYFSYSVIPLIYLRLVRGLFAGSLSLKRKFDAEQMAKSNL